MSMQARSFPWRRFFRRRFPAHAEGWVYAQVPLWWLALLLDPAPGATVDAFYAVVALPVALGIVGALVLLAALLRFPWVVLLPFCVLSMTVEAWWHRRSGSQRRDSAPLRLRWYLANPVAWWQRWWLKRVRRALRTRGQHSAAAARATPSMPRFRVGPRPAPDIPGPSALDYAFDHFEPYMMCWYGLGFLGVWTYVASSDSFGWPGGLFIALLLYGLASVTYVALIPCLILGLLSAWVVGLGLSPQQREAARPRYGASDVSGAAPPPDPVVPSVAPPARPRPATSWLLPLALGLWIGSTWGDDD